jgi:Flp pilus assembly protein TadG
MSVRRSIRGLARDEGGAAIIELALAAPILAMLVIGIVDLSNAYARKLTLEQAAQRGMEKIMQTTEGGSVDDTAIGEIAATAAVDATKVTMSDRLECTNKTSGARRELPATDECNTTTEYEARYLLVTVRDEFTPMFPITFGANAEGRYPMTVKVGMRTQ